MARSRLGRGMSGAVTGSRRERSIFATVELPLAGGPWRIAVGEGAAGNHSWMAGEDEKAFVVVRCSFVVADGAGWGSGSWPWVLRKTRFEVGLEICQPEGVISTVSVSLLARSIWMLPSGCL